jgi:triphosphatase
VDIATETELKLAAQPQHLPALIRLLEARAGCSGHEIRLVSTYFDTPDRALARQGMTLRVREREGRFLQTVKSGHGPGGADTSGAVLVRGEWEDPVADKRPDPRAPLTGRFIPEQAAGDLVALVRTDVVRRVVTLSSTAETYIEAAVDQGHVTALRNNACEPICEIELELKRGDIVPLYDFALEILAVAPVRLERNSKSARGFRLAVPPTEPQRGPDRIRAVHASEVALDPTMTAGAARRRIARSCIDQIVGNEAAVLAGMPEGIHQMRVGVRRLRALLSAFAPLLPVEAKDEYGQFSEELRWLGNILGRARDLDVFAEDIVTPALEEIGDTPGIAALNAAIAARRAAACADAAKAIGSSRYTALVLRLLRWSEESDPRNWSSTVLAQPLARVAPELLKRRFKHVRRRGAGFARQSLEERHRLRIALKKLRYATEFLGHLCDPGRADRLVQIVKRLQQELGEANDLETSRDLVTELAHGRPEAAAITQAGVAVLEWREEQLNSRECNTSKQVAAIRDYPSFW